MSKYNLIEYSDNYSDTRGSLSQFKRNEEQNMNNGNPDNVATNDSSSFKQESSILGNPAADGALKNAKRVVPANISCFPRRLQDILKTSSA